MAVDGREVLIDQARGQFRLMTGRDLPLELARRAAGLEDAAVRVSAALPTGVAALLFESARRRREAEERLVARLREGGYSEVILPILDYLEPYESLLTPASRGELYRFVDRDGELLALRADFTPMLARLLAPRLASLELPLRLFYRGDVIRYQEERAGRPREFYQLGAELLGLAGERAEREVLRLFLELATAARRRRAAGGARLRRRARPAAAGGGRRRSRPPGGGGGAARAGRGAAGLPDAPRGRGERRARTGRRSWEPEAAARLRGLLALRDELAADFPGVLLTIDLAEFARNSLDPRLAVAEGERPYYDGLVFHAYAGPAALPVGGGGRYDRLFRALGAEVPAVGFSLSLERLLEASAP